MSTACERLTAIAREKYPDAKVRYAKLYSVRRGFFADIARYPSWYLGWSEAEATETLRTGRKFSTATGGEWVYPDGTRVEGSYQRKRREEDAKQWAKLNAQT